MTLDQKTLTALLRYDATSGEFTWKKSSGRRSAGSKAGGRLSDGYWGIRINGVLYRAHRLAWLYTHGVNPDGGIDHIDGNRLNNSISNLRVCSQAENMQNAFYSAVGFSVSENAKRFKARIRANGKQMWLGSFATAAEATEAYRAAKRQLHSFSH